MQYNIPILVIVGPTASGKTELSIKLAEIFNGEIISADSMQIYKGMNIGTAKPTIGERKNIPHHLIDFLEPHQSFSVSEYVNLAKNIINEVNYKKKLPIIVGGTGLYINSLIDNSLFEISSTDKNIRKKIENIYLEKGKDELFNTLKIIDSKAAEKIHPNNIGRVIRAIEVYEITGKTISKLQEESKKQKSCYNPCIIGLSFKNRQNLYDRINKRVDLMIHNGLLDEVKSFMGNRNSTTALQAIGYKELFDYINGNNTLENSINRVKQQTRRYAKRQLTWFKRDERINWIYCDENSSDNMLDICKKIIKKSNIIGV